MALSIDEASSESTEPILSGKSFDPMPLLLFPAIMLPVLPFMSFSTWVTLTVAGLAMGMIIFLAASGLTLILGLMDVVSFGHGAFATLGAYVAYAAMLPLVGWAYSPNLSLNIAFVAVAIIVGALGTGLLGIGFERILIRPVYGNHLKQMLVTMGGLIIIEELIKLEWGGEATAITLPSQLRGAFFLGDVIIEKYRMFAVAVGLVVVLAMMWTLNRTKIGLLIRAGVQNREMVENLGYRIDRLFIGVFAAGCALAGVGGVMWSFYQQSVWPQMGNEITILIFVVIMIGGLGSTLGCLVSAMLVSLISNYAGFLAPIVAPFSYLLLMVFVLFWRPAGLYPLGVR